MKVRLILSRAAWKFKLHTQRAPTGEFYAYLSDRGGQRQGAIIALPQTSLDAVVSNAQAIYAQLVAHAIPHAPELQPLTPHVQEH